MFISAETVTEFNNEGTIEVLYNSYRYEPGDDLVLEGRMKPEYNTSGRLESVQYFTSVDDGESWFLEMEVFYTYNNPGQLINEIEWSYSYTTFQLEKSWLTRTEYNVSGDISTETYYAWDEASEIWMEEDKDEYSYNTIDFSDVLYPFSVYMYDFMGVETIEKR